MIPIRSTNYTCLWPCSLQTPQTKVYTDESSKCYYLLANMPCMACQYAGRTSFLTSSRVAHWKFLRPKGFGCVITAWPAMILPFMKNVLRPCCTIGGSGATGVIPCVSGVCAAIVLVSSNCGSTIWCPIGTRPAIHVFMLGPAVWTKIRSAACNEVSITSTYTLRREPYLYQRLPAYQITRW